MYLPMKILSEKQEGIEIVEEGFLDCGAIGKFIDQNYTKDKGLDLETLKNPIKVYNMDGTLNKWGMIRHYMDLNIKILGRTSKERFLITGLGQQKIILGFPWLAKANAIIDWEKGTLKWRKPKKENPKQQDNETRTPIKMDEERDKEESLNLTQNPLDDNELSMIISTITGDMDNCKWINSKLTNATKIQTKISLKKEILPLEEQIPKEFHEYLDGFSEEKAARFPEPRTWDHKIELKDTFIPKSFKMYNLTPQC